MVCTLCVAASSRGCIMRCVMRILMHHMHLVCFSHFATISPSLHIAANRAPFWPFHQAKHDNALQKGGCRKSCLIFATHVLCRHCLTDSQNPQCGTNWQKENKTCDISMSLAVTSKTQMSASNLAHLWQGQRKFNPLWWLFYFGWWRGLAPWFFMCPWLKLTRGFCITRHTFLG